MGNESLTIRSIAEKVGGTVVGDDSASIRGIAPIDAAGPEEITFALDEKNAARLADSRAAAAIVPEGTTDAPMPLICVANVNAAVAAVLGELAEPEALPPAGVHPTAVVAESAVLSDGAAVGPGAVIGDGATIGARTVLCANVIIAPGVEIGEDGMLAEGVVVKSRVRIGRHVRIGPNSVIGWDGFGYYFADGVHHKFPHIGGVVIEDDVEIGACSCIDRGKFGDTVIGAGSKIDNLVQIAHNVQVGRGCVMAAQVGIAGSAKLGQYVALGGHAGIRDNISLGNGVQCAAFAAVAQSLPDGAAVVGVPARPSKEFFRSVMASAKVPELIKKVKELESRLKKLESPEDNC